MAMATAYYSAAHFNTPTTTTANHPSPSILKLRAPTLSQQRQQTMRFETPSQNMYIHAAQNLAKYGYVHYQSSCLLFQLPSELRNQIYTYLLCPDTPISTSQLESYTTKKRTPVRPLYPAILRTCRRINHEARAMLYANILTAHPALLTLSPSYSDPTRPIPASAISNIKRWSLTIRLDTDPRFTKERASKQFSGAEFLEIRVWQSMYDGADASVLGLFTGVRGVKVARVRGCRDEEVARRLERVMMRGVEEEGDVEGGEGEWVQGRDAWTFGNR